MKSIFNTVKNFRANSVFQGKNKLLKNPERWKIFNAVHKRFEMHVKDAIGTEENVTLQTN